MGGTIENMKVLSEIREKRKGVEARYLVEKKSGGSEEEKVKIQLTSLFLSCSCQSPSSAKRSECCNWC